MFEVKMDALMEAAAVLNGVSRRLEDNEAILGHSMAALRDLSMTDDILVRLSKARAKLNTVNLRAARTSQALQNIWYQYRMSEREIVEFCELSRICARRETPLVYRFDWIFDMLNNEESGG